MSTMDALLCYRIHIGQPNRIVTSKVRSIKLETSAPTDPQYRDTDVCRIPLLHRFRQRRLVKERCGSAALLEIPINYMFP